MRYNIVLVLTTITVTNLVAAAPLSGRIPPPPERRGDVPKPSTLHALIFGSVVSGIALVLTKQIWADWQIYHMDPSKQPLPISLTPDPQQAAHDQRAVTKALQRIVTAAESQQGKTIGELELSPEDAAVVSALTPEQKALLGHILLSSASGPATAIVPADSASHSIEKRQSMWHAGISGVLSGIAFATSAVLTQEFIDRKWGPTSSWQRRSNMATNTLASLD